MGLGCHDAGVELYIGQEFFLVCRELINNILKLWFPLHAREKLDCTNRLSNRLRASETSAYQQYGASGSYRKVSHTL